MLLMIFFSASIILISMLLILFFLASKMFMWEESMASSFECGFTSYFFSRYSFSMHYFLVGLVFLFLDLELCFIMPFFNGEMSSLSLYYFFFIFIVVLISGVIIEWSQKKIDWKY